MGIQLMTGIIRACLASTSNKTSKRELPTIAIKSAAILFMAAVIPASAVAGDALWFDNQGPTPAGSEYDYFDASRWDGGSIPSSGDVVLIDVEVFWDFSDPLDVPNILRNQQYKIRFDPLSHLSQSNTVNYYSLEFSSHSLDNNTFIQSSGTINLQSNFFVSGGNFAFDMEVAGGVNYHFGGAALYRIEGGTLNIGETGYIGNSARSNSQGLNAQFELAGGAVNGNLKIGAQGNGSYLQTGGTFTGNSIGIGHDSASNGDDPNDFVTPTLTLQGGVLDVNYLTAGNYGSSGHIQLEGGTLLLDTDIPQSHIKLGANTAATMVITGTAEINPDAPINRAGGLIIQEVDGIDSTVTQDGNSVARFFSVANDGVYRMNGGLLEAFEIDNTGKFVQNAGTVKVTSLFEPTNNLPPHWQNGIFSSSGSYILNGGALDAHSLRINDGSATIDFNMTGGTLLANTLFVTSGLFEQNGGVALVGYGTNEPNNSVAVGSAGRYYLNNGNLNTSEMWVSAGGLFRQTDGTSALGNLYNSGDVIFSGGDIRANDLNNTGRTLLSNGTVTIDGSIDNGASAILSMSNLAAPVTIADASVNRGEVYVLTSNVRSESNWLEKGKFSSSASTTSFNELTVDEGGLFGLYAGSTAIVHGQFAGDAMLTVGKTGVGSFEMKGGSRLFADPLTTHKVVIGEDAGSYGLLSIYEGSIMDAGGYFYAGQNAGSEANIRVSGAGSTLSSNYMLVGGDGEAGMLVNDGAQVTSSIADIGYSGIGAVTVDGGRWDNQYDLSMGANGGRGSVTMSNGGVMTSNNVHISSAGFSFTQLGVTGTGSALHVQQDLTMSGSGFNSITVSDGAMLTNYDASISSTSAAIVSVSRNNAIWITQHNLDIGSATGARAQFDVYDNASADIGNRLRVMNSASSLRLEDATVRTASLQNAGTVDLRGVSEIFGDVSNNQGGIIKVAAASSATFHDAVAHDGDEINVAAGGTAVYLGDFSGAGSFTGDGLNQFEAGFSLGDSPAISFHDGEFGLGENARTLIKLGGINMTEFDMIDVSGIATLAGELQVDWFAMPSLCNTFCLDNGPFTGQAGDSWDILNAETIIGEFDLLTLALLDGSLAWDVDYLLDDFGTDTLRLSIVNVSSVPVPAAVWLFGSGLIGLIGMARLKAA